MQTWGSYLAIGVTCFEGEGILVLLKLSGAEITETCI